LGLKILSSAGPPSLVPEPAREGVAAPPPTPAASHKARAIRINLVRARVLI
jgi:hypothetical protein